MSGEMNGQVGSEGGAAEVASAAGGTGEVAIVSPADTKWTDGYADTDQPPPAATPSAKRATVGRQVHVYSDRWPGPRPGIVVFAGEGERPCYTVNVSLDGTRLEDRQVLSECRQAATGNSFAGLALYDPLTADRRNAALALTAPFGNPQTRMIAEWPPVV